MRDFTPGFWLVMGVILLTLEVVTPGFVIFFFGLAAVIVGVLSWLLPIPQAWQLFLFAVCSVASLLILRRQLRAVLSGRRRNGTEGFDESCVGQHAVVVQRIAPPAEGRVEMHGASWSATAGEPLEAGTPVEVVGRDGLTLSVKRR